MECLLEGHLCFLDGEGKADGRHVGLYGLFDWHVCIWHCRIRMFPACVSSGRREICVLGAVTLTDSILSQLESNLLPPEKTFLLAFVKFMFFSIIFPKIAAFSAGPKQKMRFSWSIWTKFVRPFQGSTNFWMVDTWTLPEGP
jgi:hypothetical protein